MTRRGCLPMWSLAVFSALLLVSSRSAAQSFDFVAIDVPCSACTGGIARQTIAQGVNAAGDIVGVYRDANNNQHGFLLRHGQFTGIDVPDAVSTNARGIGLSGEIVGSYTAAVGSTEECTALNSPSCMHGFLYSRGKFSTITFPKHPGAFAQRITPAGNIYGCLHDFDTMGSMFGAVWTRFGDFSLIADGGELADPAQSVPNSMNNGATPDGTVIVGHFVDMAQTPNVTHGFIVQNGTFQVYDVPNSTLTQIWDINPGQELAGSYKDSANKQHGFVQLPDNAAPVTVDYPGATATIVYSVNPGGVIVGQYTDSGGKIRGFRAVPVEE